MSMVKIGNLFRCIYGHITGRPTNFNWIIEDKLLAAVECPPLCVR